MLLRKTKLVMVPHEPGETIEIRALSWLEMDEARKARELLDWDKMVRERDRDKADATARAGETV